jgi:hypothetical protein
MPLLENASKAVRHRALEVPEFLFKILPVGKFCFSDLPLKSHPAAFRALAGFTPYSAI